MQAPAREQQAGRSSSSTGTGHVRKAAVMPCLHPRLWLLCALGCSVLCSAVPCSALMSCPLARQVGVGPHLPSQVQTGSMEPSCSPLPCWALGSPCHQVSLCLISCPNCACTVGLLRAAWSFFTTPPWLQCAQQRSSMCPSVRLLPLFTLTLPPLKRAFPTPMLLTFSQPTAPQLQCTCNFQPLRSCAGPRHMQTVFLQPPLFPTALFGCKSEAYSSYPKVWETLAYCIRRPSCNFYKVSISTKKGKDPDVLFGISFCIPACSTSSANFGLPSFVREESFADTTSARQYEVAKLDSCSH